MKIHFTKMHGLGNDFIVIDSTKTRVNLPKKIIRDLCQPKFGIGADQLLIIANSRKGDFKMTVYNQDGSVAQTCGNGLRAVAKYLKINGLIKKSEVKIETENGIQQVRILSKNKIRVNMGNPILKGSDIPINLNGRVINRPIRIEGREFRITCVSMGNPHCVIFVNDFSSYPVAKFGPMLERYTIFPKGANVEFVKPVTKNLIEVRVWERGVGETLACGSGSCAAAVASVLNGYTDRELEVKLKGGKLLIEWNRDDGNVYKTGPATVVFEGNVDV